jgi:hypothetical protein
MLRGWAAAPPSRWLLAVVSYVSAFAGVSPRRKNPIESHQEADMGIADRLRNLTKKAEDTAVEHKDQIHEAVQKAETTADQRTGGKYHEQIQKAGEKADAFVDNLGETEKPPVPGGSGHEEGTPGTS